MASGQAPEVKVGEDSEVSPQIYGLSAVGTTGQNLL